MTKLIPFLIGAVVGLIAYNMMPEKIKSMLPKGKDEPQASNLPLNTGNLAMASDFASNPQSGKPYGK